MSTIGTLLGFALAYWFFDGLFGLIVVIIFMCWLISQGGKK